MPPIILASSSPYRRQLLERLQLPFTWQAPNINEQPQVNETPIELVKRLSIQKAKALSHAHHNHLIIGSDQVAVLDGKVITKPGNHTNAKKQLRAASGNTLNFFTGLCVYNSQTQSTQIEVVKCVAAFKDLSDQQIERYLQKDQPYDCAGSFKAESLGISLFEYIRTDDPNSLIGLPLIALCRMLSNEGVDILT